MKISEIALILKKIERYTNVFISNFISVALTIRNITPTGMSMVLSVNADLMCSFALAGSVDVSLMIFV
ncbi:hypothetical protein D3C75_1007240 [compost metagenome]